MSCRRYEDSPICPAHCTEAAKSPQSRRFPVVKMSTSADRVVGVSNIEEHRRNVAAWEQSNPRFQAHLKLWRIHTGMTIRELPQEQLVTWSLVLI